MLLLKFQVDRHACAIAATRVRQVVPWARLRPLPHAPTALRGLFQYHGRTIPVLDVGILLGVGPVEERLSARIMIVERGSSANEWIGLLAGCVNHLVHVAADAIKPSPLQSAETRYLHDLAETPEGILQLIDVDLIAIDTLCPDQHAATGEPP